MTRSSWHAAGAGAQPTRAWSCWTEGEHGGHLPRALRGERSLERCCAAGAPVATAYGCGDSFAAGLTFALATGMQLARALELAARCGAVCLTGRGPYEQQLSAQDL